MKKGLIIGAGILLVIVITLVIVLNKSPSENSLVEPNQQSESNLPEIDYGNAEDYLLSDSEIESVGLKISRQLMRGPRLYPDEGIVSEAGFQINFDLNVEPGSSILSQRVKIFQDQDKAIDHFEMRKEEDKSTSSPNINVIEFSETFGDKSYVFYMTEELSHTTTSYFSIIFVKDNTYVELISHADETYHENILQLVTMIENKL